MYLQIFRFHFLSLQAISFYVYCLLYVNFDMSCTHLCYLKAVCVVRAKQSGGTITPELPTY